MREVAAMKVIKSSTQIARAPREVFDYVSDAARLHEWQPSVQEAGVEPPGVRQVGMRGFEVRNVPGGRQKIRWEVTECEPGSRWAIEGIEGPVRAHVVISLTPSDGTGTLVEYRIQFEGHGIGKLIGLMATRGARTEVPASLALLKQRLESSDRTQPASSL
jgi:uncharacterized protein YndB with AHSA1/START domain